MKKICLLVIAVAIAGSMQAQSVPTTDSIRTFTDRYIRNSAIDAFQNLRLNTVLKWLSYRIDTARLNGGGGGGGGTVNLSRTQGTQSVIVTPSGGGTTASIDSANASRAGTITAYKYRQLDTLLFGDSLFIRKKVGTDSVFIYTKSYPYTNTDSSFAFVDLTGGGGGSGTVTSVAVSSTDLSVSGSPITTSGTITANLTTTGVSAGTYGSATQIPQITVDNKGRVTSATALTATQPKKAFYYASDYGIYPDNTDVTAKVYSLDSLINANGGGVLFFDSACGNSRAYRFNGRIQLAHNGALIPYQSPRKWMGLGSTRRGAGSYNLRGATVFDLRFTSDSNAAQIDTRGIGSFELTGIDFVHTVDVNRTRFIHTTNTVVYIHDNYFKGFNSGTGANEDVAIWGGKNGGGIDSTYESPFQGYGCKFENNVLDGIRSGVIMQRYCNNNWVRDNNFWNTCGGVAAIIINSYDAAQGDVGNVIEGNLIQTNSYTYGILVHGGQNNTIIANSSFDGGASLVAVVQLNDNSQYNNVHAGKGEATKPYINSGALLNNWYWPSEQNGQVNIPFGVATNGTQSKYTGGTSPRIYQVGSTVNNSYIETFSANEAGIRINDDYVASWARTGTNRNMRLNGSGSNTYWSDGASFFSSAGANESWFGNDGYTYNFYSFQGNAHYRGTTFNLAGDTRFRFSSNNGSAASGHDVLLGRDSIGQLRVFDAAGTGYGGLKLGKLYATAPAQYAANYGGSFNDRSLIDKKYADSAISANSLPSQTGNADKVLTTNGSAASWGLVLLQGNYTPTLTNTTNVAASTAYTTYYYRVGDMVTVFGEVDIDPTAVGAFELRISLPFTTGFTGTNEAGGTGATTGINESIEVTAVNGGAVVAFKGMATDIANRKVKFNFSFKITPP